MKRWKKEAEQWLKFAYDDIEAAEILISADKLDLAAYHLQQAVEKSLKAIFVFKGLVVPKTHNIGILLDILKEFYEFPDYVEKSSNLTDYAFTTRYPDDYVPVSKDEYEEAYEIALKVYEWAKGIIEGSALE